MDYPTWEPFYRRILEDFGFSREEDEAVARELDGILGGTRVGPDALRAGLRPSVLVTDLDGDVEDQVRANAEGTIAVVHAHGDNGPSVRKWAARFRGRTLATTHAR